MVIITSIVSLSDSDVDGETTSSFAPTHGVSRSGVSTSADAGELLRSHIHSQLDDGPKVKRKDPQVICCKCNLPKKKTKRIDKSKSDHELLPPVKFPNTYVRGAKNSHFLVQNRCCYSGFINTYMSVVGKLPADFHDLVSKIGFGQFLQKSNVVVNSYHLDDLVGRYMGNYAFKLKDKVIRMTIKDVGNILDIPSTGLPIFVGRDDDTSHETRFWKKYFGVKQVTSTLVKEVFLRTVSSSKHDQNFAEDCVRLWLCLLFSSFLLPTSKKTMPLKMFHYLENLDDLKCLNWSQLIFEQLFRNMNSASHSVRRRERIGDRVGEYIHGCVFVLNVFLWERSNLFPPTSLGNRVIFHRYEGSSNRGNRTISSLSNDEVSMFPFVYTGDGPSQEVSNRRLFQPTLMEFKHYTRMRKGKSNLRKCTADVVVCKTSCADNTNVNGHDCVEAKITDVHMDVPTTVDLCTPSPTLSFDSSKDNPMNELFDCIERNEKFECQTVDGLGQECQKIDSPVVLQGFELYEYMLVEPCQNLEITSDEVSNDVTTHVTTPSPEMCMPPNIQTSELPVVDISSRQPLPESNGTHVLNSSTNQSVCPPSFELLDQSYMDVCDNTKLSVLSNIPVKVETNLGKKPSTPYTYSKSNLILVVEEGQSMYSQLCNDVRYSKISGMRPNGNAYTQLRLNEDYMSPAKTIELLNDMRTPLLNGGTSQANSIFISSPDFWASVVASADALESTINPPRIGDISDVARRINFSQSDSIGKESPYVSSMIKRVKDRNAEKVANKRKKDRECHLIDTNNGALVPKLNQETKRLVMKAEYRSSSFYLIANDNVTCLGQHLNDILQHKTYDVMLVEVFFGVIRAELAEKCVHGSRFQFVNPELFDDEYEDRTSRVVPQLVNSRDVEIHHNVVCASMNGDFKRHGRFYIIAMKTMTHWHFLLWSRAENRYTHYDSNRELRGAVNTGAAKRTAMWMTKWFEEFLFIERHSEPQFVDCLTFPQEINPKLDGGLYMFHGISSLIDYLHIEDGLFNDISLDEQMSWKKSDVPKLRNCLFRRLAERMEYSDWTVKMKNSNIRKRRFK